MINTTDEILNIVSEVSTLEGIDKKKAFEKVINYVGYDLGVVGAVSSAKLKTSEYLSKNINVQKLKGYDYLGEVYEKIYKDKVIKTHKKFKNIIKGFDILGKDNIYTMRINNISTGAILFDMVNIKNVLIYGTESNKTIYKICVINVILNKFPAKVMFTREDMDLTPYDDLWEKTNIFYI